MIFKLITQGGQELVELVGEGKAAMTVYSVGKQLYGRLMGFIDKEQVQNAAKLSAAAAENLKVIDEGRLSAPSPSVLTPLLEAAVQESRAELQTLWAALLAQSMIDNGRKVRREFTTALASMEPLDALVLQKIAGMPSPGDLIAMLDANIRYIVEVQNGGIGPDGWMVACRTLSRIGCIVEHHTGRAFPLPVLTPFGRLLLDACKVV